MWRRLPQPGNQFCADGMREPMLEANQESIFAELACRFSVRVTPLTRRISAVGSEQQR